MNPYAIILEPAAKWLPGLNSGELAINVASGRVVERATGRIVGALVPSRELSNELSALPMQPQLAAQAIQQSASLAKLEPALTALQATSTVGALASVATLGVSIAGFALVLRRLSRIDAKLDELLGQVEVLKEAVDSIRTHVETLSLARIRAAGENLDRALAAETAAKRMELAARARDLFQEAKAHYLELWRASSPWSQLEIPVATAIEMQGRYVACALGEIQAEFIGGDLGTYRKAVAVSAESLQEHYSVELVDEFRARCDAACRSGHSRISMFREEMGDAANGLKLAAEITASTVRRIEACAAEADLVESLSIDPHELVQAQRSLEGVDMALVRIAA